MTGCAHHNGKLQGARMADWMSQLPAPARDKPLMTLAIPGSLLIVEQRWHLHLFISFVYS